MKVNNLFLIFNCAKRNLAVESKINNNYIFIEYIKAKYMTIAQKMSGSSWEYIVERSLYCMRSRVILFEGTF